MRVQAFIFDVYRTLLRVDAPPSDAEPGWAVLWTETFGGPPAMSYRELSARCQRIVSARHQTAHNQGITWPEISWPSVVAEALPPLATLAPSRFETFIYRGMQLEHRVEMTSHTAAMLSWLAGQNVLLGIASNAQAYSIRELQEQLSAHKLKQNLFDKDLCFWSYQNGFSKPDPHVFRTLSARLELRGVAPETAVMVGDRLDNDIEPARKQGWQVWHCGEDPKWEDFRARFSPVIDRDHSHFV